MADDDVHDRCVAAGVPLARALHELVGLGIRGRLSPDRRSRKAREVRFHLVEDE